MPQLLNGTGEAEARFRSVGCSNTGKRPSYPHSRVAAPPTLRQGMSLFRKTRRSLIPMLTIHSKTWMIRTALYPECPSIFQDDVV